jgi:hypothetical protein
MTTPELQAVHTSVIDDDDAVRAVVQMCLEGEAEGDVGKLKQALHPDAWMFGELAGTRYDVPIQALFDMSAQAPADTGSYRSRILAVTCHGDVATATVAEDGYWGTVSFLDLLSLCRIDGTWKIVNKTFAHLGATPPPGNARWPRIAGPLRRAGLPARICALPGLDCSATARVSKSGAS